MIWKAAPRLTLRAGCIKWMKRLDCELKSPLRTLSACFMSVQHCMHTFLDGTNTPNPVMTRCLTRWRHTCVYFNFQSHKLSNYRDQRWDMRSGLGMCVCVCGREEAARPVLMTSLAVRPLRSKDGDDGEWMRLSRTSHWLEPTQQQHVTSHAHMKDSRTRHSGRKNLAQHNSAHHTLTRFYASENALCHNYTISALLISCN